MRQLLIAIVVALSSLAVYTSCTAPTQVGSAKVLDGMRKVPALAWLDGNKNAYALASNRFGPTAKAREFINELLRLGAKQVYVADPMEEESRIKREGGPYADALIVELPQDKAARSALFKVFAAEAKREGFDPEPDRGQSQVLLWWD
jgi:hypothetical protein